jgi:hypothetical protein
MRVRVCADMCCPVELCAHCAVSPCVIEIHGWVCFVYNPPTIKNLHPLCFTIKKNKLQQRYNELHRASQSLLVLPWGCRRSRELCLVFKGKCPTYNLMIKYEDNPLMRCRRWH